MTTGQIACAIGGVTILALAFLFDVRSAHSSESSVGERYWTAAAQPYADALLLLDSSDLRSFGFEPNISDAEMKAIQRDAQAAVDAAQRPAPIGWSKAATALRQGSTALRLAADQFDMVRLTVRWCRLAGTAMACDPRMPRQLVATRATALAAEKRYSFAVSSLTAAAADAAEAIGGSPYVEIMSQARVDHAAEELNGWRQ